MTKSGSSRRESDKDHFTSALQWAAGICSRQEQCTAHIREKLSRWNISPQDAEKIITRLQDEHFLDDARYARFFVRDKFQISGWGRLKIMYALKQKKISEDIMAQAMDQIDGEAYLQTCVSLLKQKSLALKEKNRFTRKGKLFRFASGRGFEPDIIYRALNMMVDN
jgi:regulatory protein